VTVVVVVVALLDSSLNGSMYHSLPFGYSGVVESIQFAN